MTLHKIVETEIAFQSNKILPSPGKPQIYSDKFIVYFKTERWNLGKTSLSNNKTKQTKTDKQKRKSKNTNLQQENIVHWFARVNQVQSDATKLSKMSYRRVDTAVKT